MATYKEAGVDIAAGDEFVRQIKPIVRDTFSPEVLSDIGHFGAFFDASFPEYKHPVLVSSVDGVGTKVRVATLMNRYDTVGQDLVNHCVNDIAVCGAKPLYFLDYYASGKLDPRASVEIVTGFAKACKENGCSLIGGETAEMPAVYDEGDFDIAGAIVGVVEKDKIIKGDRIEKGNVLVGMASTGLHTNGYSLARTALLGKYHVDSHVMELGKTLGEELLSIHRSYYPTIQALMAQIDVRGFSHITGGGIVGNTMRIIPKGLSLKIDWKSWIVPHIFALIQNAGAVPDEDMRKTFNLGIGCIAIVPPKEVDRAMATMFGYGEKPSVIGEVV
jgi:phosphoribosylformylglycinamidine cyclo-ligase